MTFKYKINIKIKFKTKRVFSALVFASTCSGPYKLWPM